MGASRSSLPHSLGSPKRAGSRSSRVNSSSRRLTPQKEIPIIAHDSDFFSPLHFLSFALRTVADCLPPHAFFCSFFLLPSFLFCPILRPTDPGWVPPIRSHFWYYISPDWLFPAGFFGHCQGMDKIVKIERHDPAKLATTSVSR